VLRARLGNGLGSLGRHKLGVVGGVPALDAPILAQTSGLAANPLTWTGTYNNSIIYDGAGNGDKIRMRYRLNGGAWTTEADVPLDAAVLLSGSYAWPLYNAATFAAGGLVEVQEQKARFVAGVETLTSAWTALSDTIGALAFNPSQVTGIKDYYKVSTAKLWKDTAGTVPVTADGDAVARWDSEMGVMDPFTQATLANRPLYRANAGNPYLDFDGVNDSLICGTTNLTAFPQPFYEIAAVKLTALGNNMVFDGSQSGQRATLSQNNIGSPNYQWDLYAGTFVGTQGLVPTTNDVVIGGLFNGASSKGRIDQTDGTTISIGSGTFAGSGGSIRLGAAWDLSTPLGGRIYGFVLVGASPSAGDKTSISTYLGALQGRSI
jgi:hypothetical protein